ncbi:MAG: DUF3611 family protein [Chromatiaceae bacterium]
MLGRLVAGLHASKAESLGRTFTLLGWTGFWSQLVLGSIPLLVMLYVFLFSGSVINPRAGLPLVEYLSLADLLLLLFLIVWFYRYTRIAKSLADPATRPTESSLASRNPCHPDHDREVCQLGLGRRPGKPPDLVTDPCGPSDRFNPGLVAAVPHHPHRGRAGRLESALLTARRAPLLVRGRRQDGRAGGHKAAHAGNDGPAIRRSTSMLTPPPTGS